VSERSERLAAKADEQITDLLGFLAGLSEADLQIPCHDDLGGSTVGTVAAHIVDGYSKAAGFLQVAGFLTGTRTERPSAAAMAHGHGHVRVGSPREMAEVLERDGKAAIDLLRDLTDEQFDAVPPAIGTIADGVKTLGEVVGHTLEHQAAHLARMKLAVTAPEPR
jgi:DinB superfamily